MPPSPEMEVHRALGAQKDKWLVNGEVLTFQVAKIAVATMERIGEFVVLMRCPECGREQEGTG